MIPQNCRISCRAIVIKQFFVHKVMLEAAVKHEILKLWCVCL